MDALTKESINKLPKQGLVAMHLKVTVKMVKDDDLEKVVTNIVNKVGINITERDMQAVHRIGKEGRTIIKFSNRKDCQALLKVKRDLNNVTMKDFDFEENNKIYVN